MAAIDALKALYDFYDDLAKRFSAACHPGCTTCCSVNVSITSLEAVYLKEHASLSKQQLQKRIADTRSRPYFIPSLTTNVLACHCLQQQNPPEEKGIHAPGPCPLLSSTGLCHVYTNRPFACRAMLSTKRCQVGGEAVMAPFIFTINLAIYQLIEHLDFPGTSGNMLDMLVGSGKNTVANTALPGFLVPAEERTAFHHFFKKIKNYPVGSTCLADYFPPQTFSVE